MCGKNNLKNFISHSKISHLPIDPFYWFILFQFLYNIFITRSRIDNLDPLLLFRRISHADWRKVYMHMENNLYTVKNNHKFYCKDENILS